MNIKMDTLLNRVFRKMDDLPVHTIPNHRPPKIDILPKTFLQLILLAKWLVRLSNTSTKQQRQPLPSMLHKSLCYFQSNLFLPFFGLSRHCSCHHLTQPASLASLNRITGSIVLGSCCRYRGAVPSTVLLLLMYVQAPPSHHHCDHPPPLQRPHQGQVPAGRDKG